MKSLFNECSNNLPVFTGDFNVNTSDSFCSLNGFKNLINDPAYCIDLILTNQPTLFQCSTVETGLSDFHLLTVTEFITRSQICKPHIITYQTCKNYDNVCL